jgi:hypothetical protein
MARLLRPTFGNLRGSPARCQAFLDLDLIGRDDSELDGVLAKDFDFRPFVPQFD